MPALLLAEPFAERDGIVPAHIDDRMVFSLGKTRVAPKVLGVPPLIELASFLVVAVTAGPDAARLARSVVGRIAPLGVGLIFRLADESTKLANGDRCRP